MFENFKRFETDFAGRPLVIETGKMAQLANGECLVRYGETVVHVAATASAKPRDGIDFFPLSVDFEEKLYSVGKIPGSFLKREGRPSEKATLVCRMIDRPIRPLFPKDMRNDVAIVCTVMSVDQDCSPEIAAMVGRYSLERPHFRGFRGLNRWRVHYKSQCRPAEGERNGRYRGFHHPAHCHD